MTSSTLDPNVPSLRDASAFMRMKLGAELSARKASAHVFETHAEAVAFAAQRLGRSTHAA